MFTYFRFPNGLSQAVYITRWVTGLALIASNWWVKTEAHHVVKDYRATASSLAAAIVFDGVFGMALVLGTQSVRLHWFHYDADEELWEH